MECVCEGGRDSASSPSGGPSRPPACRVLVPCCIYIGRLPLAAFNMNFFSHRLLPGLGSRGRDSQWYPLSPSAYLYRTMPPGLTSFAGVIVTPCPLLLLLGAQVRAASFSPSVVPKAREMLPKFWPASLLTLSRCLPAPCPQVSRQLVAPVFHHLLLLGAQVRAASFSPSVVPKAGEMLPKFWRASLFTLSRRRPAPCPQVSRHLVA